MLTVVIIENSPLLRLGIKTAITLSSDIEVSGEADCGVSGLKVIEQTKPDIVVVDLDHF